MTQPTAYSGRPVTPAPGVAVEERRVARLRRHGRHFVWAALLLVAVAATVGYFTDNLPAPLQNWMLWTAAGVLVAFAVILPWLRWLAHTYTITTRRVIEQSGIVARRRREVSHVRGYTIRERRGPVQRMFGAGTLTLDNGVDAPLRLVDVPDVRLVHEVLGDQVEVSQILAHRDSHAIAVVGEGG